VDLNIPSDINTKIKMIQNIPAEILAKVVTYIDRFKKTVENYYKLTDTITLPYNISLLIRY